MTVPILRQGAYLVVVIQDELTDADWHTLRDDLFGRANRFRSRGVVIDVCALEVMDSFASRMLDGIARMLRFRGAETVVVGIQPAVAFAMARLGLHLPNTGTALDLDDGLAELRRRTRLDVTHGH
jgi:rsbT antagonist protein RsbS